MILIYVLSFILWAVFGSFSSVLIRRTWMKLSWITTDRSRCPNCKHILSSKDLIPIISWILQKWKCRYCNNKISIMYPLLEIIMGLFFVWWTYIVFQINQVSSGYLNFFFNNFFYFLYAWFVGFLLVNIMFYDIVFFEIWVVFWVLAVMWILIPQFLWIFWNFNIAVFAGLLGFIFFMVIKYSRLWIRKIDWLGGWDAFGAFLIWLFVPFAVNFWWLSIYKWPAVLFVLLFSWIILWFIFSVLFILTWNLSWNKASIPFLPYMIWWAFISFFFLQYLIKILF